MYDQFLDTARIERTAKLRLPHSAFIIEDSGMIDLEGLTCGIEDLEKSLMVADDVNVILKRIHLLKETPSNFQK